MTSAPGRRGVVSVPERTLGLSVGALAFTIFLVIAVAIALGLTHGFDAAALLALRDPADPSRPFGPAWLQETARDFTALGSNGVLTALTAAGAGLLSLARRRTAALFLLASFWGALIAGSAAKLLFERPRPELVPHAARVFTTSFPSSHATVSAAAGLAVAMILAEARPERRFRLLAAWSAVCLVIIIGLSRVYLGVHWPTDVGAGWALGTGWAALCWAALGCGKSFALATVGISGRRPDQARR